MGSCLCHSACPPSFGDQFPTNACPPGSTWTCSTTILCCPWPRSLARDENVTLDHDALCQRLMALADETDLKYGPDSGALVLLDACVEIASIHSRDIVHRVVDSTYNRLDGKPRKPSPQAH